MHGLATAILSLTLGAPDPAPPAAPPAAPPPAQPGVQPPKKPAPADPIGGLDDILGIPGKKTAPPAAPPDGAPGAEPQGAPDLLDPTKQELERQLSAAEAEHAYREAIREMGEAADRIEKSGDLGVVTQRLHGEILRKLEVVIKRAKEQEGEPSGDPQSGNADAKAQQQQQTPSQPQMKENAQAGQGENRGEAMPPAPQSAQLRGQLDTARAAWGALPERVRDSLLQGSNDYFSALYQAMTEAYYKKIAEEAKE